MPEHPNVRLNSWKEIAEYLERDVSTVSRWEKKFGLPVHRVGGGKGRSVFVYTGEIDEWLARTQPNEESINLPANNIAPVPADVRSGARKRWYILGAAVLVAVIVLFGTRNLVRSDISKVRVSDGVLTAFDANQQALWKTAFDDAGIGEPPALVDLNASGDKAVVALDRGISVTHGAPPRSGELVAFSTSGRRLWSFGPEISLKFGDQTYEGPWPGETWTSIQTPSGPIFALAVHHYTWWPGLVITLDGFGKVLGKFINSGWVTSFGELERGSNSLLLAGGISNSNDAAMLAVLDLMHPAGVSPEQPGSNYECRSCSGERPRGYFVFPRSELNRTTVSRFNQVISVESLPGRVLVHVLEVDPKAFQTSSMIEAIYEFTPDMQLRGFRFSDQYWDLHRHLELDGKVNHSQADCPDRTRPRMIRSWLPDSGWTEIPAQPL